MAFLLLTGFIALAVVAIIYLAANRNNVNETKGQRGERKIGSLLSSLPTDEYIILNDLLFSYNGRTTQIDHIVVSTYGVFVIETKNYKGWIFGNTDKDYWTQNIWGKKYSFYNPLMQNRNHIKFLYEKFDLIRKNIDFVHSVVVFLGASRMEVTGDKEECVVWANEILGYISGFDKKNLTKDDCYKIAMMLEKENIKEIQLRLAHNDNVRETIFDYKYKLWKDICPRCGGKLVLRDGIYGDFYGCSNYPSCRFRISAHKK